MDVCQARKRVTHLAGIFEIKSVSFRFFWQVVFSQIFQFTLKRSIVKLPFPEIAPQNCCLSLRTWNQYVFGRLWLTKGGRLPSEQGSNTLSNNFRNSKSAAFRFCVTSIFTIFSFESEREQNWLYFRFLLCFGIRYWNQQLIKFLWIEGFLRIFGSTSKFQQFWFESKRDPSLKICGEM